MGELEQAVARVETSLRKQIDEYRGPPVPKVVVVCEDDLRILLSAAQEKEWQPIETAPKDGTNIFVWWVNRYGSADASERVYWERRGNGGTWVCRTTGDDLFNKSGDHATHWMPQPSPPNGR